MNKCTEIYLFSRFAEEENVDELIWSSLFVRLVDELGSTWLAKSRRRVDALKKKEKREKKEKVVEDIRAT